MCGGGRVITTGAGSGGGSGPLGPLAVFEVVEVVGEWVVPPVPVLVEGGGPSSQCMLKSAAGSMGGQV